MSKQLGVEVAARAHVGHVRRRNEDAFYQGDWLYVVADGLGGHIAGDIASTTAIEAVRSYDRPVPAERFADTFGKAVSDAHETIRRRVRGQPELAGMGTTMVGMLRSGDSAS
jgi:protein phosphatase